MLFITVKILCKFGPRYPRIFPLGLLNFINVKRTNFSYKFFDKAKTFKQRSYKKICTFNIDEIDTSLPRIWNFSDIKAKKLFKGQNSYVMWSLGICGFGIRGIFLPQITRETRAQFHQRSTYSFLRP